MRREKRWILKLTWFPSVSNLLPSMVSLPHCAPIQNLLQRLDGTKVLI
jgi:hypothetical protein